MSIFKNKKILLVFLYLYIIVVYGSINKCIDEHGTGKWPYTGPGNCHNVGWCQCQKDGSVACVC